MLKAFREFCKHKLKNSITVVSFSEATGGSHWAEIMHCSALGCKITIECVQPLNSPLNFNAKIVRLAHFCFEEPCFRKQPQELAN